MNLDELNARTESMAIYLANGPLCVGIRHLHTAAICPIAVWGTLHTALDNVRSDSVSMAHMETMCTLDNNSQGAIQSAALLHRYLARSPPNGYRAAEMIARRCTVLVIPTAPFNGCTHLCAVPCLCRGHCYRNKIHSFPTTTNRGARKYFRSNKGKLTTI